VDGGQYAGDQEGAENVGVLEGAGGAVVPREQLIGAGQEIEVADEGRRCGNRCRDERRVEDQARMGFGRLGDEGGKQRAGEIEVEGNGDKRGCDAGFGRMHRAQKSACGDHEPKRQSAPQPRRLPRQADDGQKHDETHRQRIDGSWFAEHDGARRDRDPDERKRDAVGRAFLLAPLAQENSGRYGRGERGRHVTLYRQAGVARARRPLKTGRAATAARGAVATPHTMAINR